MTGPIEEGSIVVRLAEFVASASRRVLASVSDDDDSSVFESCSRQFPTGNTTAILECISNTLEDPWRADTIQFLLTISGAMIFFMQTGFAMLCAGCVQLKNVQNTMLKNLLDACGSAVAFFLCGYAFAYGGQYGSTETTFIGTTDFVTTGPNPAYWFFEYTFSATAVTIIAGALAERCQMAAYLCYSVVLSGIIYPIVVHQVWSNNGFLSVSNITPFLDQGVIDFAGSGAVHLTGGTTALYATLILGPRRGRFHDEEGELMPEPTRFPGHSVALQLLGTMILWFGWFGFNAGSALNLANPDRGLVAANAAVSTALSAATGALTSLFTHLFIVERRTGEYQFVMLMATNGALSGLVAVTSGCAVVEPWAALVIGTVAGWIYLSSSALLERLRIDDAVNAIPVHMFNGMWGLVATGLLASPNKLELTYGQARNPGLFYSFGEGSPNGTLLACQVVTLLMIGAWTFCTMIPFFSWLNYKGWLRADSYEELVGLDISYHGGGMRFTVDNGVGIQFIEAHKRQQTKQASHRGAFHDDNDESYTNTNPHVTLSELPEVVSQSRETWCDTNYMTDIGGYGIDPNSPGDLDTESPLIAIDMSHEYVSSSEFTSKARCQQDENKTHD